MSKDTIVRNFQRWTETEDMNLRQLVETGHNSEEIARALGRTRASVLTRKSFLGITTRMEHARGATMPMVSFKRKTSNTPYEDAAELQDRLEEAETANSDQNTLGQNIDTIVAQATAMGLRVKITLSNEE